MTYLITGNLTYSTAGNRNSALASINSVLSGYSITNVTTTITAGVNSVSTASLTISIRCSDADMPAVRAGIETAWQSTPRATTGHWIAVTKD